MNQKGFANILLVILIVILLGTVGYFVLVKKSSTPVIVASLAGEIKNLGDGSEEGQFDWSPTEENVFALIKDDNGSLIVYKVDNGIREVMSFKGNYSSFTWSLNGEYILARRNAEQYKTFPQSLVALNVKNGTLESLVGANEFVKIKGEEKGLLESVEIKPCQIAYTIDQVQKLLNVDIPSCKTYLSYNPFIYSLTNPFGDWYGKKEFFISENGNIRKLPQESFLSNYFRNGSFFDKQGKKLSDAPPHIRRDDDFTWSFDHKFVVGGGEKCLPLPIYLIPLPSPLLLEMLCQMHLFVFDVVGGKEFKISGIDTHSLRIIEIQSVKISKNNRFIMVTGMTNFGDVKVIRVIDLNESLNSS